MNEFRAKEEEIKYEFLKILDQSMLMYINPIQFHKLKRRKFIDYLVKNWNLEDIVAELLIHPDVFQDKHKINLLISLLEKANNKLEQANKKKYTRVFNPNLNLTSLQEKESKQSSGSLVSYSSIAKKQMTLDKFISKNN
jgi:hypothetical protein